MELESEVERLMQKPCFHLYNTEGETRRGDVTHGPCFNISLIFQFYSEPEDVPYSLSLFRTQKLIYFLMWDLQIHLPLFSAIFSRVFDRFLNDFHIFLLFFSFFDFVIPSSLCCSFAYCFFPFPWVNRFHPFLRLSILDLAIFVIVSCWDGPILSINFTLKIVK